MKVEFSKPNFPCPSNTEDKLNTEGKRNRNNLDQFLSLTKTQIELTTQSLLPTYFPDKLYAKGNISLLELGWWDGDRLCVNGEFKANLLADFIRIKYRYEEVNIDR